MSDPVMSLANRPPINGWPAAVWEARAAYYAASAALDAARTAVDLCNSDGPDWDAAQDRYKAAIRANHAAYLRFYDLRNSA